MSPAKAQRSRAVARIALAKLPSAWSAVKAPVECSMLPVELLAAWYQTGTAGTGPAPMSAVLALAATTRLASASPRAGW